MNILNGKKTYIAAAAVAITAGLRAAGYDIPDWVPEALAAAGLFILRATVGKTA